MFRAKKIVYSGTRVHASHFTIMTLLAQRRGSVVPPLNLKPALSVENDEDRAADASPDTLQALFECLCVEASQIPRVLCA